MNKDKFVICSEDACISQSPELEATTSAYSKSLIDCKNNHSTDGELYFEDKFTWFIDLLCQDIDKIRNDFIDMFKDHICFFNYIASYIITPNIYLTVLFIRPCDKTLN